MEGVEAETSRSIRTSLIGRLYSDVSCVPLQECLGQSSRPMPIHDMLYRCPRCGHDPLGGHKGRARCFSCGTRFEQGRGSVITVRPPEGPPEQASATSLIADIEKMGDSLFREARVAFGVAEGHDVIRWRGEVLGFSERISWKGEGLIKLDGATLTFTPVQDSAGLVRRRGRAGLGGRAVGVFVSPGRYSGGSDQLQGLAGHVGGEPPVPIRVYR